ncbi:16S rRNA pseudouridine(516) synthase RsuA [Thalassotalea atypica]|uniref:16S rRNA pseudouridine(516) synthase RsuA n=1 Tax=Thalassotalea atypica TaxID=2054316 RepID=UPI002573F36B|nr:16S rRNA pseudouridine(516) synthase RsuA [Thalassotalea atypica]
MRLDKYICKSTELTRSEAKRSLKYGSIKVNGAVVKNAAFQVKEQDNVLLNDRELTPIGLRYIMMHKPADTICSNVDEALPSLLNLIEVEKWTELHIAGRLDADTTGLVLITDDGQWSHNVISPNKSCQKTYHVWLAEPIVENVKEQFEQGVQLNNEKELTRPAKLEILSEKEAMLSITEGKYHQVKRMFAAVGNKVVRLHREKIGNITLDEELEPGQWRYLTNDEVDQFH